MDGVLKKNRHIEGGATALVPLFGPSSFMITQSVIHIGTSVVFQPFWDQPAKSISRTRL